MTLFFTLLVVFSTSFGLFKIKSNFSVRTWLDQDGVQIQRLNEFEYDFGSEESIIIQIYNPQGIFNKDSLKLVSEITEKLYFAPEVLRVNSLSNYNWVESRSNESSEDEIEIDSFIDPSFLDDPTYINSLKKKVPNDKVIVGSLVSEDLTYTLIQAFLKPEGKKSRDYNSIMRKTREIVSEIHLPKGNQVAYLGTVTINDEFEKAAVGDLVLIFPIVSIIVYFILFWFYRSPWIPLAPFLVLGITITTSFSIMGHVGILFSNLSSVIPAILVGIGFADCIHVITSYAFYLNNYSEKIALKKSLLKNFYPTLLTTITTSIGFLSLVSAGIRPISDLGIVAATGVFCAWIFTFLILAPLLAIYLPRIELKKQSRIPIFFFVKKFKMGISLCFFILVFFGLYLSSKNTINNDHFSYFSKESAVYQTYVRYKEKMKAARLIYFVADSGEKDGVKNPEFVKKLDSLKTWALKTGYIENVHTLADLIKRVNRSLHNDSEEHYKIPDSRKGIAEILFFYTLGLPSSDDLNSLNSFNGQKTKLTFSWNIEDTATALKKSNEIVRKGKELGLNIRAGGLSPIYNSLNNLIVKTFANSMKWTFLLIFILMLIYLKDFKLAIISMAPNLIPLIIGGGVLYLMGDFVEIGSVTVCSICMGIAIDDTIHFLVNFKNNFGKSKSTEMAIKETIEHTGFALVITTIVLLVSFGLFIFTDYMPNRNFGFYSSLVLLVALLTDILLLPVILIFTSSNNPKLLK